MLKKRNNYSPREKVAILKRRLFEMVDFLAAVNKEGTLFSLFLPWEVRYYWLTLTGNKGRLLGRHRFRALTLCSFERQTACWRKSKNA